MICISSNQQIRERAYEIFQDRQRTARKGDADSDWHEAENEIRKHRSPAQASMLHLHPKPNTPSPTFPRFRPRMLPSRLHPGSIGWSAA